MNHAMAGLTPRSSQGNQHPPFGDLPGVADLGRSPPGPFPEPRRLVRLSSASCPRKRRGLPWLVALGLLLLMLATPGVAEPPGSPPPATGPIAAITHPAPQPSTQPGIQPGTQPTIRSSGQTVYVAVYSHIYFGDRLSPFLLTATVMVRNTDPHQSIVVETADYFDSDGRRVRALLDQPTRLPPLASLRFVIPESDTAGGAGASVLVRWSATRPANPPLIESVMVGTRNQQGVSFTSRGQVLDLSHASPAP